MLPAMPEHWFFLSYARADGPYVTKFLQDVAQQVRSKEEALSKVDPAEIGFMDRASTEPGDDWDHALLDALCHARVLVCMLSRGYLASEYCAKEFEVFRRRIDEYKARLSPDRRPRLIMPVLGHPLTRLGTLPPAISHLQYDHVDFGELYPEKGLFALSNHSRYQQEYEQFLEAFTWKLVDAAREHPLPPSAAVQPLSQVVNPFRTGNHDANDRRQAGPTSIRFVFVAGHRDEAGQVRDQLDAYGASSGREWRPFLPATTRSVGALSSGAASDQDLFPEDLPVDDGAVSRIRHAEEENSIVLLIVDPWSARLARYRDFLESYDRATFLNSGVLVLWNLDDEETARNETALREALSLAISRTYIVNGYIRDSVRSADQFQIELVQAVHEIRRRMAARGTVFQNARSDTGIQLPQLAGPGGAS